MTSIDVLCNEIRILNNYQHVIICLDQWDGFINDFNGFKENDLPLVVLINNVTLKILKEVGTWDLLYNDIFLKAIFLLTLHNCQPKNVEKIRSHRPRYGYIGVLNLCGKSTLDIS